MGLFILLYFNVETTAMKTFVEKYSKIIKYYRIFAKQQQKQLKEKANKRRQHLGLPIQQYIFLHKSSATI